MGKKGTFFLPRMHCFIIKSTFTHVQVLRLQNMIEPEPFVNRLFENVLKHTNISEYIFEKIF